MSLAVGSPPSFQIPTGEPPGVPGMSDFAGAVPDAVQPVTLGPPVGATPVSLPPLVPMTPGSDATDSSVGGTTPGGTHVCLRHDKHQAKKKCTCGKARRYKQQSRGYKPPAPDAEHEELVRDGIAPVIAALDREISRPTDASVGILHWGCLGLGNVCYARKNADAVKREGGEEALDRVLAAHAPGKRGAVETVRAAAERAKTLLNRETYRDEEARPTGRRGSGATPKRAKIAAAVPSTTTLPSPTRSAPSAMAMPSANIAPSPEGVLPTH